MPTTATCTFKIEGWDEDAYAQLDGGGKLTRASVKQSFSGDIEGDGSVEWLMCYAADETATFVGLQHIEGALGGRRGSFALVQTDGTFDGGEARGKLAVAPGSGSGELAGVSGSGQFSAPLGGTPVL